MAHIKTMTLKNHSRPFNLSNDTDYRAWRDKKLSDYPATLEELLVPIQDPRQLTHSELKALYIRCDHFNMAIYAGTTGEDSDPDIPLALGRQMGLHRLDRNWLGDHSGLTSLTVRNEGDRQYYIPYTDRPIRWHTDGYYNPETQQVQGLLLHCVSDAASGGENALMDHEIAYILLRDENPDFIRALMHSETMTIPARAENTGKTVREQQTGPVFSITKTGHLHMRYTERQRNIVWRDDPTTRSALTFLTGLFTDENPYLFRGRLQPGMGLICNNVLHNRTAFSDHKDKKRLLYRARYYDRIG